MKRIVVTGLGLVTPVGHGVASSWENILQQQNGIAEVTSFDTSKYRLHRGCEVKDFDPSSYIKRLNTSEIGRASQLAISAAGMAIVDAGLDLSEIEPHRVGVCMGTTSGEPGVIEQYDDFLLSNGNDVSPVDFARLYPCHVVSAHIAAEFHLDGVNLVIPTACAAGNYAIAHSFDTLRAGRADFMLAGGADAFSRITYTGFYRLGAIAPEFCQPFDLNRKGMVPGEGAAVLVLETEEKARQRGAEIYAEVAGYGLSCDAHHMTGPHPEGLGAARAMQNALADAELNRDQVSYICTHGTGTKASDKSETAAIKQVFQEDAYRVPASSIKSMLGHTMGAASAIEAAVCSLAVKHDVVPPTANFQTPDPDCDLDYVTTGARNKPVNIAMNNAYAFGGNNASVIFQKYKS
jgi:3-oxoacyl-[acyl-carrier-protein] synthase II